ncbi:adenylate/guanylate cyclase domain-containing protein [Bradyrhizobium guangzhouense]|uniref:Adenylate/guanylate cyclase domain-containing protein n=3 Tax=Bradyrhizobium guangzhouense TaxID=1325095 RepID=A0AAE5X573_9BRAD|nr:adenylate/guanylate cyclase domain-containing protein [Bradyrhizobium guangzhouense]
MILPATQVASGQRMSDLGEVSRKLVAVFAADVEGYSRLMGTDEVGTLKGLTERRTILDKLIGDNRGRIANTAGDSVLAEFGSAVDAVQCAVEAQAALAEANAGVPFDKRINFRMGVHIGDVMVRAGDLFGDGVNIAARLQTLAKAGTVCISGAAYDQVRKVLPLTFTDLGSQQVKNIDEPIRVYQIGSVVDVGPTVEHSGTLPLPDKPSLAVLPFQNMSGDPEQEYFADGMAEDIITALSRFTTLFVIARNSSFTFKGKSVDVRHVGRELGVRYVLEGSIRRAGGRLRITAQLIDAAHNKHVWAERLDGDIGDIFDLQDALTAKIVNSVSLWVEKAELERVRTKPTTDLDAYELYVKGMALQRYERRFEEAYRLFVQAFTLDPGYAAAYAMAGYTLCFQHISYGSPIPPEVRSEALGLAQKVATLPHEDAHALARAAHILSFIGQQYDLAKELADRAVTLNPSHGYCWMSRGWVSINYGEAEAAIECFMRVLRLDPLDPHQAYAWTGLACAYNALEQYETGFQWAMKAVEAHPLMYTLAYLVINAVPAGRMIEARDALSKMLRFRPDLTVRDTLQLCLTKDTAWLERMARAFREVGLPE